MEALDAETQGELATDLSAAEFLRALFPEELPHPLDVWDRIRSLPRHAAHERAFLEGYFEIAKGALMDRYARDAAEAASWRERGTP